MANWDNVIVAKVNLCDFACGSRRNLGDKLVCEDLTKVLVLYIEIELIVNQAVSFV